MLRQAVPLALILLASGTVAAQESLPPRAFDLSGARAEAMGGAFRAFGAGNETLFLNPAGLGASSRYEVTANGAYDFGYPDGSFGASILDSLDGPILGGLAISRFYSGRPGSEFVANDYHLDLALPLGPNFTVGVAGKWLFSDAFRRQNVITPDVGLLLHVDWVSVGLVGYNLVNVHTPELPLQFAGGLAFGPDTTWKIAADVVADTMSRPETSFSFHVGGEFSPLAFLALRAGYDEDRIELTRFITGGVGIFFPPGIGADVAYRNGLEGPDPAREVLLTLRYQPFAAQGEADQNEAANNAANYLDQ